MLLAGYSRRSQCSRAHDRFRRAQGCCMAQTATLSSSRCARSVLLAMTSRAACVRIFMHVLHIVADMVDPYMASSAIVRPSGQHFNGKGMLDRKQYLTST